MKRNRDKEESSSYSIDLVRKQGEGDSIAVYLALAVIILVLCLWPGPRHVFQKKFAARQRAAEDIYVWQSGSAEKPAGLHLYSPNVFKSSFSSGECNIIKYSPGFCKAEKMEYYICSSG